jgi:hypothetical protein
LKQKSDERLFASFFTFSSYSKNTTKKKSICSKKRY